MLSLRAISRTAGLRLCASNCNSNRGIADKEREQRKESPNERIKEHEDAAKRVGKKRIPLVELYESVKVADILREAEGTQGVEIDGRRSVLDAIKSMASNNVGAILVRMPGEKWNHGIFTERDYVNRLILKGRSSRETAIEQVMTPDAVPVDLSETLLGCSNKMHNMKSRHFPVVPDIQDLKNDTPQVGTVSSRHLIKKFWDLHKSVDLKDDRRVENVFNNLGRYSSQQCFVHADSLVYDALQLMSKFKIAGVFVHDEQMIVGIFTERDYLTKIAIQGKSSHSTRIRDVMTHQVKYVAPSSTVDDVLELMAQEHHRVVPVLPTVGNEIDDSAKDPLIGLITSIDIFHFLNREKDREVFVEEGRKTFQPSSSKNQKEALMTELYSSS